MMPKDFKDLLRLLNANAAKGGRAHHQIKACHPEQVGRASRAQRRRRICGSGFANCDESRQNYRNSQVSKSRLG
jgi:hypothetical protein